MVVRLHYTCYNITYRFCLLYTMNNTDFQDESTVDYKFCEIVETHKRLDLQVTVVSVSQYCLVLTLHYIGFRSNFQSLAVLSDNNSAVSDQHSTLSAFCNNNIFCFSFPP